MATVYSKQRPDGTVAHYDTEAEMLADTPPARGEFDFSIFWAVVGFFVSVLLVSLTLYALEPASDWPKAPRFGAAVLAVAASTYVISRTGWFLVRSFLVLLMASLIVGILGTILLTLWHFA